MLGGEQTVEGEQSIVHPAILRRKKTGLRRLCGLNREGVIAFG